jgi:alkylation response protein AidB-like acyl-CoA dehydrogenase
MSSTAINNEILKGGAFLITKTHYSSVFIPEQINEEQQQIVDMCEEFVQKEIRPNLNRIDEQEPGLMEALMTKAGEMGLLGMSIPEELGGFGKDVNTFSFVTEVMGSAHSFSVAFAAHTGIGTLPILYFGTEAQKQKYIPDLANGIKKASYCLTEPGSGSDALAARTTATLTADGKHYSINGQKMWITNAGFADVFIVFAKIDGDKFTGFIIDKDAPGLSLGAEEHKMGIKGSSTRQVFFQDCLVPVDNLLGEIGKGHKIAFNILNIGRFKLCVAAVGGIKRVITQAIEYANERVQFKVPIASFGAIQHKLAEMAIRCYAIQSATYRVSQLIENQEKQNLAEGKDYTTAILHAAEEYAIECAMLKVSGSEVLDYVVDEGVQIYGGYGFSEEYPMARAYRDSRINRIFEGTNEINRMLTVDMLMKRALKGQLDLMTPAMAIQKELMSMPDMTTPDETILFAQEKKVIENMKKAILMIAGAAVQKLMMKLESEQEILMNITDMMIDTFNAESMMLRVEKLTHLNGEAACTIQNTMVKVYINDAADRLATNGRNAINAFAEGDELRIMHMGLKRFAKTTPYNTKNARRAIAEQLIKSNKWCF